MPGALVNNSGTTITSGPVGSPITLAALGWTPVVGNWLYVGIRLSTNASAAQPTVSDNVNGAYSILQGWFSDGSDGSSHGGVWKVPVAAATAPQITFAWTGGNAGYTVIVWEVSGTSGEDVGARSGNTNFPTGAAITPSGPGILFLWTSTVINAQTFTTPTDNAGGNAMTLDVPAAGTFRCSLSHRSIGAPSGTYAPQIAEGTSEGWTAFSIFALDSTGTSMRTATPVTVSLSRVQRSATPVTAALRATLTRTATPVTVSLPPPSGGGGGPITFIGAQYSAGLIGSLPAGTASGDLLVCHVTAGEHTIQTGPAGWTQINQLDATSPVLLRVSTWWIIRGSTAPALTWAGPSVANTSTEILAYRGVEPTSPIGATSMNFHGTTFGVTFSAAALDIAAAGNWRWSGLSFGGDPGTVLMPSGMTSRYNRPNADWFAGADQVRAVAGDSGFANFTTSTSTAAISFSVELVASASGVTRTATPVTVSLSALRRTATPVTASLLTFRRTATPVTVSVSRISAGRVGLRGLNTSSKTTMAFNVGGVGVRGTNSRPGLGQFSRTASPTSVSLLSSAQSSAPVADVIRGNWTTQTGGTTNLFNTLDEVVADDADFVQSTTGPAVTFDMQPVSVPLAGTQTLRYHYGKDAGAERVDLLVELLQGATVLQSWTHSDVPVGFVQANQTITATIGNYSALRVRLTPSQPPPPTRNATPVSVSLTAGGTATAVTVTVTGSQQFQVMDNSGVDAEPWILEYSGPDWQPMAERMISEGRMRWWGVDPYGDSDWITSTSQLNNTFTDAFYATDPHWQYAWQVLRYLCDRTDMVCITFTGRMPAFGTGDGWHIDTAQEANTAAALGSAIDYARRVLRLPIKYVSPMNECDMGRPAGPEGPDITPAQYIRVSKAMLAYLDARGYTDILLVPPNISDIGSINTWFGAFLGDATIMPRVRALTVHIYRSPATGGGAYGLIQGSSWPSTRFWYTEFGQTSTDGDMGAPGRVTGPADEWVYARQLTSNQLDLLDNGASSTSVWNAWDAVHHHNDQYSFYGLWGYTNQPNATVGGTWFPKKRYFTSAQIMRFIQAGWRMVTSTTSNVGLITVVFSNASGGLTIVGQNTLSTPAQLNVSLAGVGSVPLVRVSYTTQTQDLADAGSVVVTGGTFSATVPADSFFAITTLTSEQTHTRPAWPITASLSQSIGTNHQLAVGLGFSDVSPHQLVRNSSNILYLVVPTCASYPDCPSNALLVYSGNQTGLPTSFIERDAAHRPTGGIGSSAIASDGAGLIHVIWNDRVSGGRVNYAVFNTGTNLWGTTTTLQSTGWSTYGQGDEGVAIALDASGKPHAVWNAIGVDGRLHIQYSNLITSTWSTPIQIDDVTLASNHSAWHPTLAFTPIGDLLLAWHDGTFNQVGDATVRIRTRLASGTWNSSVAIPDVALTGIDNGPSLLVTPDGVQHLTFLNANDEVRYWYNAGSGWLGDQQTPLQVTHDPSLGPDGTGGIYIYGHGSPPVGDPHGHGDNLFRFHKSAGSSVWSAFTLYTTGSFDSSVSTRWAQFFHLFPDVIDIIYWADAYPNNLFAGVN